jgi:hypothetical protein
MFLFLSMFDFAASFFRQNFDLENRIKKTQIQGMEKESLYFSLHAFVSALTDIPERIILSASHHPGTSVRLHCRGLVLTRRSG